MAAWFHASGQRLRGLDAMPRDSMAAAPRCRDPDERITQPPHQFTSSLTSSLASFSPVCAGASVGERLTPSWLNSERRLCCRCLFVLASVGRVMSPACFPESWCSVCIWFPFEDFASIFPLDGSSSVGGLPGGFWERVARDGPPTAPNPPNSILLPWTFGHLGATSASSDTCTEAAANRGLRRHLDAVRVSFVWRGVFCFSKMSTCADPGISVEVNCPERTVLMFAEWLASEHP